MKENGTGRSGPARIAILIVVVVAVATALALKNNQGPAPEPETEAVAEAVALPRLLDLGADKCVPCKMMAPILEKLDTDLAGQCEVDFIDVWKNPDEGPKYGIRVIPTQILFDAEGNELMRHEGFFSREDILAAFAEHGIRFEGV